MGRGDGVVLDVSEFVGRERRGGRGRGFKARSVVDADDMCDAEFEERFGVGACV